MRTHWILTGWVVVLGSVATGRASAADPPSDAARPGAGAAEAGRLASADATAIQGLIASFLRSFNAGDANATAALYTPDAQMTDVQGRVVEGRQEIEADYQALFRENPGAKIEVRVEALRMLGPDTAIEDGWTQLTLKPGEPPVVNRYIVVYVRHGGAWLHASVREYPGLQPTHQERLKELEWLLGDWVDEGSDSAILTSCRWSTTKDSLIRDFTIRVRGQVVMTGTQRIGWDPLTRQFKSWVFDSQGGHNEGLWARQGNRWVVKDTGVLQDGLTATATHIIIHEDKDTCRWRTVDRTVGGDLLPDLDEFVMVRRPPKPGPR